MAGRPEKLSTLCQMQAAVDYVSSQGLLLVGLEVLLTWASEWAVCKECSCCSMCSHVIGSGVRLW